jgi:Transmembrane domain of unknown function (DUF3566)
MAETQAKSGTTGTSIDPGELNAPSNDGAGSDGAVDRAAVGRASVPTETSTPSSSLSDSKIDNGAPSSASESVADFGSPTTADRGSSDARSSSAVGRGAAPAAMTRKAPPTRSTAPARPIGAASAVADGGLPSTGAARVAEAVRTARQTVSSAASRGPRRARLFVKRVDPWSVMKFSFAVSFVLFFVLVVATSVLYLALDQMDVFTPVNKAIAQLIGSKNDIKVTATAVIGAAGAFGLVMVVLFTALSTLASFIYNVCADLVGGIEVTLSEKE